MKIRPGIDFASHLSCLWGESFTRAAFGWLLCVDAFINMSDVDRRAAGDENFSNQ